MSVSRQEADITRVTANAHACRSCATTPSRTVDMMAACLGSRLHSPVPRVPTGVGGTLARRRTVQHPPGRGICCQDAAKRPRVIQSWPLPSDRSNVTSSSTPPVYFSQVRTWVETTTTNSFADWHIFSDFIAMMSTMSPGEEHFNVRLHKLDY